MTMPGTGGPIGMASTACCPEQKGMLCQFEKKGALEAEVCVHLLCHASKQSKFALP